MSWQKKLWYGGNYYPLVEAESQWEKDVILMKEAGINFVRTAEIVNAWDRLEPVQGQVDFACLDRFFDLCEAHGLKVLLGTGTAAPPYWLHQLDPTVNILSHTGRSFPNNATYGWACYNHPTFKTHAESYLKRLVAHYKDHKALLGYQINNEIGYPFMPLDDTGLAYYCYCDHCKAKYRQWLKAKYHTLEALTKAWSWTTTTTVHQRWEDVEPPYVKPAAWASVTRFLDWRNFHMDGMTDQVAWENQVIKSMDETHPTVTNVFTLKSQDPLGVITAMDPFSIAKHVDVIGYDLYPGSGNKLRTKPHFSSYFFDHLRSVARRPNIPYWLSEAEAGPIGGWVLGPDHNTKGVDLWRNQLEAVAHGVKAILYQLFKEMPFQPLHWGGVIGLDSSKTIRFDAAKGIGEWLQKDQAFLTKAEVSNQRIGLLMSRDNHIVLHGLNHETFFLEEVHTIYRYYWSKGFTVDFLTPEDMADLPQPYPLIHAPFLAVMDDTLAQNILAYMERGGMFVSAARLGYMDGQGWSRIPMPASSIAEACGYKILDCDVTDHPAIHFEGQLYQGHHHTETLEVNDSKTVLATFKDERPAIIQCPYAKGSLLYFATHLAGNNTVFSPVMDAVLDTINLTALCQYTLKQNTLDTLDIHHLSLGGEGRIIITHYETEPFEDTLTLKVPFEIQTCHHVLDNTRLDVVVSDDHSSLTLPLTHTQFYVLRYVRKES